MKQETVGIKKISCPITINTREGKLQHTVAEINIKAILPYNSLSASIEKMLPIITNHLGNINIESLSILVEKMQYALNAKETEISVAFPYFIKKTAPVSSTQSLMEYQCILAGSSKPTKLPLLTVAVPVTTLCPCSKEISVSGAHNQRAEATLTVQAASFIWLEELITLVEESGSCQLYALLKRPDEKYVTETAYDNPMFVEDVARKIALKTKQMKDIMWFSVGVESFESIHKHSAYAYIDSNDLQH